MLTHAGDHRPTPLRKAARKGISLAAVTLAGGTKVGVRESKG